MTENDLNDFRCFRQIHTKAVIPKAARNQKATVYRGDEAICTDLQFLAEIIAQMPSHRSRIVVAIGLYCYLKQKKM